MSHYFEDEGREERFPITVKFHGKEYEFLSSTGMFSKDHLDRGTEVLLDNMQVPHSAHVLDLGCGIGVVGILVKLTQPDTTVMQSDITQKARTLTRTNALRLNAETKVVRCDCYEKMEGMRFDVILTNPPRAAGKAVIARMINEAPDYLVPGGSLQLVAMSNKGGGSYEKIMAERFGNVEVIGRGSGFKVYKSVLTD
jgi:16S rRNA (guanine1207-N2)-methyltransferase